MDFRLKPATWFGRGIQAPRPPVAGNPEETIHDFNPNETVVIPPPKKEILDVPVFSRPVIFAPGIPPRRGHFHKAAEILGADGNNVFCGYAGIHRWKEFEKEFIERLDAYRKTYPNRTPGLMIGIQFSKSGGIRENADELEAVIGRLKTFLKTNEFFAFGECIGGLALLEYQRRHGNDSPLKRLVLAGTPNQGFWGVGEAIYTAATIKYLFKKIFRMNLPLQEMGGYQVVPENLPGYRSIKTNVQVFPSCENNEELHALNTPEAYEKIEHSLEFLAVISQDAYGLLESKHFRGIPLAEALRLKGDGLVPSISQYHPRAHNLVKSIITERHNKEGHGLSVPHQWYRSDADLLITAARCFGETPRLPGQEQSVKPLSEYSVRHAKDHAPALTKILAAYAGYGTGITVSALALLYKLIGWPQMRGLAIIGPDGHAHPSS